jgi:hypothetical protein
MAIVRWLLPKRPSPSEAQLEAKLVEKIASEIAEEPDGEPAGGSGTPESRSAGARVGSPEAFEAACGLLKGSAASFRLRRFDQLGREGAPSKAGAAALSIREPDVDPLDAVEALGGDVFRPPTKQPDCVRASTSA